MKRDFYYILKEAVKYSYSTFLSNTCYYLPVQGVPILMYHSIDNTLSPISVSPHEFRMQMAFLKKINTKVISLSDLVQECFLRDDRNVRAAVITFDDGYENNYTHAFPILKEFGFTATFFISTETIGGKPTWLREYTNKMFNDFSEAKRNRKIKLDTYWLTQINPGKLFYTEQDILKRLRGFELLSNARMMSWQQIKEMSDHGMDFGSHSLTHPFLINLNVNKLKDEIVGSKVAIEEALGRPVEFFSYPYGKFNEEVVKVVEQAKFLGACTTDLGVANAYNERYLLKRLGVRSLLDLKLYFSRGFNWYLSLRQRVNFNSVKKVT
ncbi:MAG: polysaccharide deacetylase family protein [Planctomycetota bacterium]